METTLVKYNEYSRLEVHNILDLNSKFTRNAGTWGIQGIIKIPNREKDFLLFVTYGQSQSGHIFDEGITEDGILTLQSQPKHKLTDP